MTASYNNTCSAAVVGMFDGVHIGHRHLLNRLKTIAGERGLSPLTVTFSNHPLSCISPQRAPALLTTPEEKVAMLQSMGVDVLMLNFDDTLRLTSAAGFLSLLHKRGVQLLLLGFNNRFGHDAPADLSQYMALGAGEGVEIMQGDELTTDAGPVNSSTIRKLLLEGEVSEANKLLSRPYTLTGEVIHGHELGRRLGFPTANLAIAPVKLMPRPGVYAACATINGNANDNSVNIPLQNQTCIRSCQLKAVVNIGSRPTVESSLSAPVSVEAHLLGYSGSLYGSSLSLHLIHRLRDEERFPTVIDLKKQITRDAAQAECILSNHIN